MTLFDKLTQERRARLTAEQRLEHRTRELNAAMGQLEQMRLELHQLRQRGRTTALEEAQRAAEVQNLTHRARAETESAQRSATQAERRLWDSINTIRDGFAVFNQNHELVIANQAYLGVFAGIPEVQIGISYRRLVEILAHEDRVDIGHLGRDQWIEMMLNRWEEDKIDPMVLHFSRGDTARIHDRRARGGDIVSLVRDITEQQRHAAELDEARVRAEAANRAKSAFLANMSHEIRTPMNGVVGMAELICDTSLSDEQRLYAETIRSSGEALLNIINDVLDFSKIEADKLALHPEPFDLERCIHEVLILLQAGARKRSIDLLMDYDLFMPTRFMADPGRMRQVMTNLIGNAVKFTQAGHVLIRVVGMEESETEQKITVTVEDTGIGIAPENIDKIFGEFAQVDEQANRKFEGTGLGLAITRRLIELMGGQIWVESELGKGSCFAFSLTLPLAADADPFHAEPIPLEHVMVVDDHLINRTILERQLGAQGLKVTLCEDAEQALAAIDSCKGEGIDLVITDHEMPGMDGLDLTQKLKEDGYEMPVILLSSSPAVLRDHPGISGLRAILQKPLLRHDLLRQLHLLSHPEEPVEVVEPRPRAPMPVTGDGRRMRILAAEDNKTNRLVFSKMVDGLAVDLRFAEDGLQAIDGFKEMKPDLVFMDISMPGMDGRTATREIRQLPNGAQVPIIALTAHAMAGDQEEILAAGLDHVMTKPLKKPLLLDMIARYRPDDTCPLTAPLDKTG
ncbi:response regulator [Pararhodobacter sp. CCB-MM2]|uniref:response regulator n=1 Tax=Pararhodobacter sp. CCB-MM2 TaxID=1786003 RepID=UPI000833ED86|nr:response regulator [Pararhodobacter sp. CCB-MM2]